MELAEALAKTIDEEKEEEERKPSGRPRRSTAEIVFDVLSESGIVERLEKLEKPKLNMKEISSSLHRIVTLLRHVRRGCKNWRRAPYKFRSMAEVDVEVDRMVVEILDLI